MSERGQGISTRFIFTKKLRDDGTVGRYKARLVVRGFMQGHINQTYSPVVNFTTIRACLRVAVQRGYCIEQMDVRTAFLHGEIDEDVYVSPPKGSGIDLQEGQVLILRKGLYGLRQAPRLWYRKWTEVMEKLSAAALKADPCVFQIGDVFLLLYVDDIILLGSSKSGVDSIKDRLSAELT